MRLKTMVNAERNEKVGKKQTAHFVLIVVETFGAKSKIGKRPFWLEIQNWKTVFAPTACRWHIQWQW
jgi:hypothetical protein